ncbi:MAG: insulinase family protein, partial [Acidobacteria bacterium]|nr:insulinase family protein [Acidobacteriota bacterium]
YRRDLVQRLVEYMFNERFSELARKADAKFLGAGVSDDRLGRRVSAFSIAASVPDGKLEDGAAVVATEARRVREHGFTEPELDRAKRWIAALYERAYAERDKSESGSFAQECVRHFLVEEPMPGIAYEHQLVRQFLPGITLAETSAMAKRLVADESRVLAAVSPEKPGIRVPTDAELVAALAAAEKADLSPWTTTTSSLTLLETKPDPGPVASRRVLEPVGVTVVRFANGIEAWLKPTDFKNDQIVFTLEALGGASLAPPADFREASLAASYVAASGVGSLKAIDMERLLAGKLASASPFIGLSTHGFSGSASPAELETALQILYRRFTAPGDDPDAFAVLKRQLDAAAVNREQSPARVFGERIARVNTSDHYTSQPLTPGRIAALDRGKMLAYYRDRFANGADFTFFMVGAFKVDQVVPLLARYVGSLPSTGSATSTFKDIGIHFPDTVKRAVVEKGREPKSQTVISFFADPARDPVEQEKLRAAALVLQTALRDILREDLGQTYSVSVGHSQPLPQRGAGHMQVSFGSAPENVEAMTDRVLQEIKRLQEAGPTEDLTMRAKESARREYETALKQNPYWLSRLGDIRIFGGNPEDILRRNERIDGVTPAILRDVFGRYFPFERYTVVTLMPEAR